MLNEEIKNLKTISLPYQELLWQDGVSPYGAATIKCNRHFNLHTVSSYPIILAESEPSDGSTQTCNSAARCY